MANSRTYHYELKIGDIPEGETPEFEWKNIKIFENGIYAEGTKNIELSEEEKNMEEKEKEQRLQERFEEEFEGGLNEDLQTLIRKSSSIYFLKYGRGCIGECVCFFKEIEKNITIDIKQWIPDFKILFLPEYLRTDKAIKEIAEQSEGKTKGDFEKIIACIINFNYAKQKENTIENALDCLTYYWSSFNSLYDFCSTKNGETGTDNQKISSFAKQYIDNNYISIRSDTILFKQMRMYLTSFVVNEWDGEHVTEELFKEKEVYKGFSKKIEKILYTKGLKGSAYAYILIAIAYKYRNEFIHGNKAFPILNIQNNIYHAKIIQFLNYLLDDFISNNMILILESLDSKKDGGNNQEIQPAAAQSNAASNET